MPWIDPPVRCAHRDQPTPTTRDDGRVWECSSCGSRWRVVTVDHGHDVMPGEQQLTAHWQRIPVLSDTKGEAQ